MCTKGWNRGEIVTIKNLNKRRGSRGGGGERRERKRGIGKEGRGREG